MRAQRVAGWTAVIAGLLLVLGIAAASLVPGVASGSGPTGAGPIAATACAGTGMMGGADGHMGATGMTGAAGMMGTTDGHMGATGMMGGAGMMGATDGHMGAAGIMGSAHMAGGMMGSATGGCPGATPAGAAPIAGATEVRVRAANFAFAPKEIRLPKNEAVNLTLENPAATGVVHDLTVPGLGIHVAAGAGRTATVGLRGLAAGRYDAYCAVAGHADLGMRATVIVD